MFRIIGTDVLDPPTIIPYVIMLHFCNIITCFVIKKISVVIFFYFFVIILHHVILLHRACNIKNITSF